MTRFYAEVQRPLALQRTAAIFKQQLTSIILLSLFSNIGKTGFAKAVPIDLFHCIEHRRTTRAMGNPTQRMCMTTPTTNICEENGYFMAPERGTTTRFMKK